MEPKGSIHFGCWNEKYGVLYQKTCEIWLKHLMQHENKTFMITQNYQ